MSGRLTLVVAHIDTVAAYPPVWSVAHLIIEHILSNKIPFASRPGIYWIRANLVSAVVVNLNAPLVPWDVVKLLSAVWNTIDWSQT